MLVSLFHALLLLLFYVRLFENVLGCEPFERPPAGVPFSHRPSIGTIEMKRGMRNVGCFPRFSERPAPFAERAPPVRNARVSLKGKKTRREPL